MNLARPNIKSDWDMQSGDANGADGVTNAQVRPPARVEHFLKELGALRTAYWFWAAGILVFDEEPLDTECVAQLFKKPHGFPSQGVVSI